MEHASVRKSGVRWSMLVSKKAIVVVRWSMLE